MNITKSLRTGLALAIKRGVGLAYWPSERRARQFSINEHQLSQEREFWKMYAFARARVPYYRDYPPVPSALPPVSEFLSSLPILRKQTLRDQNERFWANPPRPFTTVHTTSGTSGTPLRLAASLAERAQVQAILDHWTYSVSGRRVPRTVVLSGFLVPEGTGTAYALDPISNQLFLSIYDLAPEKGDRVRQLVESFDPDVIYGYASAVHQLARIMQGSPSAASRHRVAIVTSEVLEPHWRQVIEASLCRKVFDLYGNQEGSCLAISCEYDQRHVHPAVGIVELLSEDGKPVNRGEWGRMVLTGLLRKSMPMIRYEIGDVAESTGFSTDCRCGLQWPTIGSIGGRAEDLVITRDQRRIGLLCFHSTRDLMGIREVQLVQRGFDRFLCRIVPADHFDQGVTEATILREIGNRLRVPVAIEFEYLSQIPRGSNGKFKAVVVDFSESSARFAEER
jgi:phenylacetate-CoA ligase